MTRKWGRSVVGMGVLALVVMGTPTSSSAGRLDRGDAIPALSPMAQSDSASAAVPRRRVPDSPGPAARVVVIGAPGLRWSDIDDDITPRLMRLAEEGSVGSLSVRAAPAVTCPAEGWLTLGAGTYGAVRNPGEIEATTSCRDRRIPVLRPGLGASAHMTDMARIVGLNRDLRFGADPGWLGATLARATTAADCPVQQRPAAKAAWHRTGPPPVDPGCRGPIVTGCRVDPRPAAAPGPSLSATSLAGSACQRAVPSACVAAVGEGAALAAATPDGRVAVYSPGVPEEADGVRALLGQCPATLVDAGALPEGGARPAALGRFDDLVGQVHAAAGPDTVVLVLGLAEATAATAHLHVAVATGPGFEPGWLESTSTHRLPYVQLADVAPTILRTLDVPFSDTVAGRPMNGGAPGRPLSLDETLRRLVDTDRQAVEQRRVLPWFFVGLTMLVVTVLGALVIAVRRHLPPLAALRLTAVGLTGVPAATFLANLVPWWRSSAPVLAVAGSVALGALVILVAAVALARLRPTWPRTRAQLVVVATITLLVFVADAATGASLQLGSLLGYNPLVAGRFVGFGNIAFAVLGAAGIILGTMAADRRTPRAARAAVAGVALPVLLLDGLPQWGADFGGVLTLVPTFAILAMLVARTSVTWWRLTLAGLAGAAVVGSIGWLDYQRPEDARSHFGRFVGSVLDGGALHTIERKLLTSLDLLVTGPHTIAALALTVVLAAAVFRPPALLARGYAAQPALRPMLYTTVALAGLGLATNDSGVAIPAVIALVTGPTALALCATAEEPEVTA